MSEGSNSTNTKNRKTCFNVTSRNNTVGVRSSSDTFKIHLSILDRSSLCYFPPVSFIFCLIIVVIITLTVLIKELTIASLLAESLLKSYCLGKKETVCEYN